MRLQAAKLAAEGFSVFPLRPFKPGKYPDCVQDAKKPLISGWQTSATTDALHIVEHWPATDYGVGISTDGLVVLDADVGKGGLEAAAALNLPPTRTVRTVSGGLHFYFRPPAGMDFQTRGCNLRKDGTQVPAIAGAWGVDVRAKGGLVVAPGTVIDDKAYTLEHDLPIAELPPHLFERLRPAPIRDRQAGKAVVELDTLPALEAGRQYLATDAPRGATEGTRGWTAYQVAARLGDFGVSCGMALELMRPWNDEHGGAQTDDELEKCVEHSFAYRQEPIGRHHPARVFEPVPPPPSGYLRFVRDISLDEIADRRARALVRGVLHPGDTAVAYGESTAGKTFVMLDMAYHIAMGLPWHGKKVCKAPVLYVCLEGVDGFELRMHAAAKQLGDPGDFFARLAVHVSLVSTANGEQGVATILAAAAELAQRAGQPVGLVIIDTIARAMSGGDENAVADMMNFVEQRMDAIKRGTGAAGMAVHHPNKAGTIRGSSSLFAAMDVVLRFERDKATNTRSLIGEKVKDGIEGPLFNFELDVVELKPPTDPLDLESKLTSCVVRSVPFKSALTTQRERIEACAALQLKMLSETTEELGADHRSQSYFPVWMHTYQPAELDFSLEEHKAAYVQLGLQNRIGEKTVPNGSRKPKGIVILK